MGSFFDKATSTSAGDGTGEWDMKDLLPSTKSTEAAISSGSGQTLPSSEDTRPDEFLIFSSPKEITYGPEDALKQGLSMIKGMKAKIRKLEFCSKLRKEVWLREIDRFVY